MIKRMVDNMELNHNISPHSFRRSFATERNRVGQPIKVISILMGHEDEKTTWGYI